MRAVTALSALAAVVAATLATAPLAAVGLGPLVKEGVTDGPQKGFYLTLIDPYQQRTGFRIYAVGVGTETPADRVTLASPTMNVAATAQRRFLVVARDLAPGESYQFRVCAERIETEEVNVHARVCSRLTARRLPARR